MWLRLTPADKRAHLDLVWSGQAISTETLASWETDPIRVGSEISSLSVRDIVQRHGGEFWFERDRVRQQAFFRFLLPLASAQEELDSSAFLHHESRPEYYDFDLFRVNELSRELDERRLTELSYTVFDTETTGLDPSAGDEIIQIGATRLVNGKLLDRECFEQLVDPRRQSPRRRSRFTASRRRWWPGSRRSTRCCRRFTPSRRTPCWSHTTPRSTCASCS